MGQATSQASSQATSKPAWGYLVAAGLAAGVAGTVLFAPGVLHAVSGLPRTPEDPGSEPVITGAVGGDLAAKDLTTSLEGIGKVDLAPVVAAPPPAAVVQQAAKPDIAAPVTYADEGRATALLAEAEAAYRAMQWDKAESGAKRIAALQAKPATRDRARDIERYAPKLRQLFKDLDDRDELARGWDTHPSLVRIGGQLAVPIMSVDNPEPIIDNPVGWIEAQKRNGKVALLLQGKKDFIPGLLDNLGAVEAVDVKEIIAERAAEFARRLAELRSDRARQRSATAWYDLGRFAYRNRIDDQVTAQLEQALSIDPMLNRTVREASAQVLMAHMIAHLKNGNRPQAQTFMASINRRYRETQAAAEASAYLNNDTKSILALARQAEEQAQRQEEERRAERLRLAREKADKTALARLEQEESEARKAADEEAKARATDPSLPADIAKADEIAAKARVPYSSAMQMGPTAERNRLYHEAAAQFEQALKYYDAYLAKHPNDESAMAKRLETNKMRFAAKKYQTL